MLHWHDLSQQIRVRGVWHQGTILHMELEITRRHDHPLTKISIEICELHHRDLRKNLEVFTHDPLRPTTAGTQHKDGRNIFCNLIIKLAGGIENHGSLEKWDAKSWQDPIRL